MSPLHSSVRVLNLNNDQTEQLTQKPYMYVNCCIESSLHMKQNILYPYVIETFLSEPTSQYILNVGTV